MTKKIVVVLLIQLKFSWVSEELTNVENFYGEKKSSMTRMSNSTNSVTPHLITNKKYQWEMKWIVEEYDSEIRKDENFTLQNIVA